MSSDLKDARWGLAHAYARQQDMFFEDYTYSGWQNLLDWAQDRLNEYPEEISHWAEEFRKHD